VDARVGEPGLAQPVDSGVVDRGRLERQVDREVAEGAQPRVEPRLAIVVGRVSR
jgi:hypothetical protein